MAYKIFISSTHKDMDLARDLARRLGQAGVKVYSVDNTAVAGESIVTGIKQSLNNADEVIVILTDGSVNSPGLISEVGAAFSLRKQITPVLVGLEPRALPRVFKGMKYVRYTDLPEYISGLEKRAKAA
jgi:ATP-dependent phosphoenolpyruvate carboxykinase